jgi:hypothetical protein
MASVARPAWRILARDTAFALKHGSDDLNGYGSSSGSTAPSTDSAFDLARVIHDRAPSTIATKKRQLEKRLADLLTVETGCTLAQDRPGPTSASHLLRLSR